MRLRTLAVAVSLALLGACDSGAVEGPDAGEREPRDSIAVGEPYPFSEDAPPKEPTPIDGTYRRTMTVRQAGGIPIYCQRCAPWRLDAGDAELRFDAGRMYATFEPVRVEIDCRSQALDRPCKHPPGFAATGHYRVDGNRIEIFNDPNCAEMTGVYEWTLADGELSFEVVEDECPFVRLRAKYLTAFPWHAAT